MKPSFWENLAGLRPIRGLLISIAVSRCSVMLFPFYGAYLAATRHGLSPASIGLVIGSFGIGALAADLVVSQFTKRVSERVVAMLGMLGVALAVLVVAATSALWPLATMTAVWGFCYELINPVSYTLVAKAMPETSRRFAFAAVRLAINLGMGTGPVIAGVLFKVKPSLLVWGTVIGYLMAAGILAKAHLRGDYEADAGPVALGDIGTSRTRDELRFWSFFTAIIPVHLAYALPPTVISVYVIQRLGHAPIWASAIFAVNALMVITCEIGLNHLINHWRRRTTVLAGYACALIGFGLMGLGSRPWMLILATVVWTLGEMIIFPGMLDHISAISPAVHKARNIGLYSAGVNIGVLFAPLVFLPLSATVDPPISWAMVAALLALGMITIAVLSTAKDLWTRDDAPAITLSTVPEG